MRKAEAQVDEGVADESDSMNDTRQGFIGPLLAQGGHHDKIMPKAAEVPSIRCTGESRREELKRKAQHLSRSTAETNAFCTSRTLSQNDTRNVLETFCNVSLSFTLCVLVHHSSFAAPIHQACNTPLPLAP
jgi:hypothetical protein